MSAPAFNLKKISDNSPLLYAVAAALAVGFGIFVILTAEKVNVDYPLFTAIFYGGLFFASETILIAQKRFDALTLLAGCACVACVMFARVSLLYYVSDDYDAFLKEWVKSLGGMSIKEALCASIGDYNLPYIYILLIFSRINFNSMMLIKALSCLFDVLLAYYVMKIVMFGVDDRRLQMASFVLTLAAPTVMINSAQWSQCDAIFVTFCLMSMLKALEGKGRPCAIFWTVAFCFKMQAVFILPALGIALFMGKAQWKHLLWIPAVYLISIAPALLAGRSFASCVGIYAHQTQEYAFLFHNAPTIWRFFEGADFESFSVVSVFSAGAAAILFVYFCATFVKEMDDKDLIKLFFISAMLIPYLLPRMHERYFYLADILALIYFMYDRRKWYIPVTLILSSVIGYMFYFTEIVIIDQKYIAIVFLVILATETREFFKKFWHKTPDEIVL